jgi:putative Mg2+ transporter-C (MgtC) family protein
VLGANLLVLCNIMGALLLGLLVGYERAYHGRAAGMRTYGLVCMASCALTVIGGYSAEWFGGAGAAFSAADLSHVIQGIVTGIGFLCAGVIMREGFNISGLTTAASMWASAVIGVLVGIGLYMAAILLAALSAACMVWVSRLEAWLPSRQAVAVSLRFAPGILPGEQAIHDMANARGYDIAEGTVAITRKDGALQWQFVAVARSKQKMQPISALALEICNFEGVVEFHLSYARN